MVSLYEVQGKSIYIERERERMRFWDMAILVVALFIGG
jgi:hypothetical protein